MDRARLLEHFEAEAGLLIQLARSADGAEAVIPACPGMTVAGVVEHVGAIYRVVTEWVRTGAGPVRRPTFQGADVLDWTFEGAAILHSVLSELGADAPSATWCATDRTAGFWFRRMAHETAIHRIDVAQALSLPWTVDPDLAVDGVGEAVELWLGTQLGSSVNGSGQVVRLGADGSGWLIRPLTRLIDFPAQSASADAQVTGDAAALYAWTWGRSDASHCVDIGGDQGAAAEVRDLFARSQQ